jgi:murein DD-endopeptidase MepM/ murein hydrolase activator NlpD
MQARQLREPSFATAFRAMITLSFLTASALATAAAQAIEIPPVAAQVPGAIEQVELAPLFGERFFCVEHALGELTYAGDVLGTDCMVSGGIEKDPYRTNQWTGIARLYRTDGRTNADWYGWLMDVASPTAGTVIAAWENPRQNTPGIQGTPPGGGVSILRTDGIVVTVGHLQAISVEKGSLVSVGQVLGKVGNNGQSRAPHIHIGAYRQAGAVPLQIRWDLRSMGLARRAAGVP